MNGDLVEHGVDVFMAVLGAEGLGEFDRLVKHHLVWNLGMQFQFEDADAQNGALNRIDLLDIAAVMCCGSSRLGSVRMWIGGTCSGGMRPMM